ncbi:MAG TPA: hypothetical protein VFI20_05285 [Terracidiphilus sp.]|nr:hypothetical protein [Terracidiphilus sp.]
MTFVPVMWVVWGVLIVITIALYIYRSNLTKDEEDQIFLDDSFQHERVAQEAIVAKVNKLQPLVRTALVVDLIATLFVIGYYVYDILRQFH